MYLNQKKHNCDIIYEGSYENLDKIEQPKYTITTIIIIDDNRKDIIPKKRYILN